jgi:hypothetical protein
MRCVICGVFVSIMLFSAPAQGQHLGIYDGPGSSNPLIYDNGGTIEVYVVATLASEMNSVDFMLDITECPGLTLVDVSYNGLAIGSYDTGVSVSFIGCRPLPYVVATLTFVSTGISDCCLLWLRPHPGAASGRVEGRDCGGNVVEYGTSNGAIAPVGSQGACAAPTVPENPYPPDGAVDQPLNLTLSWETEAPLGSGLGIFGQMLFLGTDPDPPLYPTDWPYIEPPYDVGPLQPNTTYYWKIEAFAGDWEGAYTVGPVWQFTTADPVATEPSTWGRIKALYR